MRGIGVLALSRLALVACSSLQAGTSAGTSLRVSYWADGSGAETRRRVDAALQSRGRLARTTRRAHARSSPQAARGSSRRSPPDAVCTEIYGGPQRARIVGTVAGKRVWATLTRTNGCEIEPLGSRVSVARCLLAA